MYETKNDSLLSIRLFLRRLTRNLLIGFTIIILSLGGGMLGYAHFEKMSWVDAFVNAAMILSGMGPVSNLQTEAGKIFAGFYALFSGIVFLIIIAIIFSPVIHRFLHKFHLAEEKLPSKKH
jgi:hypothetical protein